MAAEKQTTPHGWQNRFYASCVREKISFIEPKQLKLSMVNPTAITEYLFFNPSGNWDFGNKVLYDLCKCYPMHTNQDEIVTKIWLIGRSYAAAIERGASSSTTSNDFYYDDFYYDVVAPHFIDPYTHAPTSVAEELDKKLKGLKSVLAVAGSSLIASNLSDILETHKFLTEEFKKITGLKKRSLASKYLHFHCPDLFFIYDSRANSAIKKIVKNPIKSRPAGLVYDPEYADFVCRMLDFQDEIHTITGVYPTPREIDTFLLSL